MTSRAHGNLDLYYRAKGPFSFISVWLGSAEHSTRTLKSASIFSKSAS